MISTTDQTATQATVQEQTTEQEQTATHATKQTATQTTAQMVEQMMNQAIPGTNVGDSQKATMVEDNYPETTKRAIQGTLKVMDGRYGGGFYVKYLMDEGTCYGWLNLVIVYPDGGYKSVILYKNAFKETDTESGNGVYHERESSNKKAMKGYKLFQPWDGPDELNNYFSLTEYETPTMPIPEVPVWKKIVENYPHIPIVKINQTASLEHLLDELQAYAAERAKEYGQGFMDDSTRYYISSEDFREIVEVNGWTVSQARTQIDMQGMFDKDSSTRGYQKSKRVGGEIKRFYVIKKVITSAIIPPKSLSNTKYDQGYRTRTEVEMKRLQKENLELVDKYNDLLQKYEPTSEPLV